MPVEEARPMAKRNVQLTLTRQRSPWAKDNVNGKSQGADDHREHQRLIAMTSRLLHDCTTR